jgi:hypothetical protein
MKRILAWTISIVAVVIAFGIYSASVTFHNWPWTVRTDVTDQQIAGFIAGSDKAGVLEQAIAAERNDVLRAMMPMGQPSGPQFERFEGSDLKTEDLPGLAPYDEWVVGLVESDKTLRLFFTDDRLAKVVLHEYRGPHE